MKYLAVSHSDSCNKYYICVCVSFVRKYVDNNFAKITAIFQIGVHSTSVVWIVCVLSLPGPNRSSCNFESNMQTCLALN